MKSLFARASSSSSSSSQIFKSLSQLNGLSRTVFVKANYKKKEEEEREELQKKQMLWSGGAAVAVVANHTASGGATTTPSLAVTATTAAASAASAATSAATNGVTLTNAGYALSPALVTVLSNAPLLAFAFVQISGISPIQNILREKQTFNYSPFPFVSLITNCSLWTLYGSLANDSTILYANLAGVAAGAIYTAIFHRYTSMNMMPYYIGSTGILSALFGTSYLMLQNGMEVSQVLNMLGTVGSVSAVILMASPLAAIQQVRKDQSTESMSLMMSTAMTCNGFCWFNYGWFVTGDPFVYVPNALGFMAGLLQLSLFRIYPSKKKI